MFTVLEVGRSYELKNGDTLFFGAVKAQYFYHRPEEISFQWPILGIITVPILLDALAQSI